MDSLKDIAKSKRFPTKKDPHLHSANHVLADQLATKLNDPAHFGLYLKLATTMPHPVLERICGQVLDNPSVDNKGRLFSYLVKQYNLERKQDDSSNHKTTS